MLSTILISFAVSGLCSLAVLLVIRIRLAEQFEEIFKRFTQVRDSLKTLNSAARSLGVMQKDGISHGSRLKQLSLVMARLQENTGRRLAPLVPLARERERAGNWRELNERQVHQLVRHWSPALSAPIDEDGYRWLLRSLQRTEMLWLDDVPAAAADVLARAAALTSLPRRRLRLADTGPAGGLLPLFLQRALGGYFDSVEILHLAPEPTQDAPALRAPAEAAFARAARMGGAESDATSYFQAPGAFLEAGGEWDALLISAGRLAELPPETASAFLAKVAPDGMVILEGEDAPPESEPLAAVAAGLAGYEVAASAGKTVILRRLP